LSSEYSRAVQQISELGGREADLWRPVLDVIPLEGASVSTVADFLGAETVSASDDLAARIDELQFDLGEGPCWDAVSSRRPVYEPNLAAPTTIRWPSFTAALAGDGVGALFAFPLVFGTLALGAMDLYARAPGDLSEEHSRDALGLAHAVAKMVLTRAITTSADPEGVDASPFSRRSLHQATGVVISQVGASPEDARLLIHAHAFASGRPVIEVAEDILNRRLDFSSERNAIRSSDD
jgi:hypothetical protein